jgi:hypothetical protein
MIPSYLFGTALTCHFGTSISVLSSHGGPLCVDSMWHSMYSMLSVDNIAQPCLFSYSTSNFRK